jgi:hypothetical protein
LPIPDTRVKWPRFSLHNVLFAHWKFYSWCCVWHMVAAEGRQERREEEGRDKLDFIR